ncbi:hypothetical protein ACIQJX_35185 [Streptomyces griseoviridis]
MISYVQVAAAMAAGLMLPVTALLVLQWQRVQGRARADPVEPSDTDDPVEAVARLAAAQFIERLDANDGETAQVINLPKKRSSEDSCRQAPRGRGGRG